MTDKQPYSVIKDDMTYVAGQRVSGLPIGPGNKPTLSLTLAEADYLLDLGIIEPQRPVMPVSDKSKPATEKLS